MAVPLLAIDLGMGPEPELVLMADPFPAFARVDGRWRQIGHFGFRGPLLKADEIAALLQRGDVRPVERAWSDLRVGDRKGILMLRPDEP